MNLRILLVAPHPFFQERGTPIAVRLVAETLCEAGHQVDLLTYHEGTDIEVRGLRIIRAGRPPGVSRIPIGISWKKILCDVFLSASLARLLVRNDYDVIHAVEESIFPAVLFNVFARKHLVYDMDSFLSEQVLDKWRALRPVGGLLRGIEKFVMRRTDSVFAVCEDLAVKARACVPAERVFVLPDVPLPDQTSASVESLREHVSGAELLGLYVGNLEHYQGIDLLLDALALLPADAAMKLVVIGGEANHIASCQERARHLGIDSRVKFLGPRPVAALPRYLQQADMLFSPRTLGGNTPMKVYSYMQSAKPIVATRIRSHTQVLNDDCAMLCEATPEALAAGTLQLIRDKGLRERLGKAAAQRVETEFSLPIFRRRLLDAYRLLAVPSG